MAPVSFTAVIPVHNKRPHLEACFASVLAQTRAPDEIIAVDDASTDGSGAWLDSFVRQTPQVTLLLRDTPGYGGYAARNLAVARARGEWIVFLDADDEWLPDHLERLEGLARRFPGCGFLCTARHETWPDGVMRPDYYSRVHKVVDAITFSLFDYLRASAAKTNPVQTSSAAVRRDLLREVGAFPASDGSQVSRVFPVPGETRPVKTDCNCGSSTPVFKRGGDRDTWLRVLERTDLAWDPVPSAVYRRDAVNMVTKTVAHQWEQCSDATLTRMRSDPALARRYGPGIKRVIDLVWNHERKAMARSLAFQGRLSPVDLRHFRFAAEPGFWFSLGLFALLPSPFKRAITAGLQRGSPASSSDSSPARPSAG